MPSPSPSPHRSPSAPRPPMKNNSSSYPSASAAAAAPLSTAAPASSAAAASAANSANALLKPNPTGSVGTLWLLRSSPYSNPVKVVLHLSKATASKPLFIPLISPLLLALRFRLPTLALTAPLLRTAGSRPLLIRESLDIARHIDACRHPALPSLFPDAHLDTMRLFAAHAATINAFMRALVFRRIRADPDAAQALYVPRALRNRFFTSLVLRIALPLMQRKYARSTALASRDAVRNALLAVRAALAAFPGRHLRYLCGERLTYADIVVAEAILFDPERHGRWAHIFTDLRLADEFPDLIAWARAVRATHFPEELLRRSQLAPPAPNSSVRG